MNTSQQELSIDIDLVGLENGDAKRLLHHQVYLDSKRVNQVLRPTTG